MTFTLINASAGSGKTHTLTHRIARHLQEGLEPSQLIATTFTKKAAAELSDRVRRTLLEQGLVEQARGIDSALIGTVNSVFGTLLQEFALDAGISPEVRVLDEERQRAAFSAAIDEAAAAAGDRARDLLARTEHDGEEEPDLPFGTSPSWRTCVRRLAESARANLLGAEDLREAAEASYAELAEAALPPRGEDRRSAWLSRLDLAITGLREDLAASEGADAAAKPPIPSSSRAAVARDLETLARMRRTLARMERAPWSQWARIAQVAQGGEGGGSKRVFSALVDRALLGTAEQITAELLAQPALQDDLRALIGLVLHTAADSLEAYERYKRELGLIDFIDQEVGALQLLRSSERARTAIRSRFRLLAVDEFQDTSPVQLALFLELSRLVEDRIWVGDPKQAIYGFRDADPSLMLGIVEQIEAGTTALGPGGVENLEHSWRSQECVLDLVNAVFPQVFADLPRERVAITAAPEAARRRAAEGRAAGRLEAWRVETGTTKDGRPRRLTAGAHVSAVAEGVAALLAEPGTAPGDVAVLVRTNSRRDEVVRALSDRGIPASGQGVPVLASREGRIIRAGLAVALDRSDTLALTELVDLLPDHPAHGSWFADLAAAPDAAGREAVLESWWRDPSLAGLRALREECIALTPVEMITALADALDLPERIRAWSDPDQRLRTLDALRRVAADYADRARAASAPITLTGLRGELDALERGPDLEGLPDTVWVGTIHTAKGLEWSRVVVLCEGEAKERPQTSGSFIVPAPQLDLSRPLSGRAARYWPDVLGTFAPLQEALASTAHARRRRRAEREESGRLQYVALTRARDVLVLSGEGRVAALDALVDGGEEPLLRWESGGAEIHVAGAGALPARVRTLVPEPADGAAYAPAPSPLSATDLPGLRAGAEPADRTDRTDRTVGIGEADGTDGAGGTAGGRSAAGATARRFQASGVASADALGTVHAPRRIGAALVEGGGRDWDRVGEAVHAYLALPLPALDAPRREQAARRLVERWAVARAVGPEALLAAGEAWQAFLAAELPGAEVLTEQPITWWNEEDQVMEGWIDALLRLPDGGHVLVDHKTYPGGDPVGHVRAHYLGQLDAYAQALTAAGRPVERVLVHLPLRGEVLEVTLHRLTGTDPGAGPDPRPDAPAAERPAADGPPQGASAPALEQAGQGVLDV